MFACIQEERMLLKARAGAAEALLHFGGPKIIRERRLSWKRQEEGADADTEQRVKQIYLVT